MKVYQSDHCRPDNASSITANRWLMQYKTKWPSYELNRPHLVVNVVLGISFSASGTWLYTDRISMVENMPTPVIASRQSCALDTE